MLQCTDLFFKQCMYDDESANVLIKEMLFIHYKMAPITGAKSPLRFFDFDFWYHF